MGSTTPLSLPLEATYSSFEELLSAAQTHAKAAGFAFVTGKTKKKNGRIIKQLNCKRGGVYRQYRPDSTEDSRKRQRSTQRINCPVAIKARERPDGTWELCHIARLETETNSHNHGPDNPAAFTEHRRLNEEQTSIVHTHHYAGISPSRTVTVLKMQFPTIDINHRDIYNIVAELSRAKRCGMPPPEALIVQLELEKAEGHIFFEWERDLAGHISFLFVADQRSIRYLSKHFDMLLLDCTYKSNKFDMPLLDIIGVDSMGCTFSVAFCFLDSEIEENYSKAIQHLVTILPAGQWPSVIATDCELALISAIDRQFPAIRTKRVICFWHICKNLMVNCKSKFETEERWEDFERYFRDVVYAKTPEEYEDRVVEFKAEFYFNDGNPLPFIQGQPQNIHIIRSLEQDAVKYALGGWLIPYHQQIVHAWVDQSFHGGTTTTSRLEGAHAVLKRWIGGPSKNLTNVWSSIKLALDSQHNELSIRHAQEITRTPISLSSVLFYGVIGKISHHGLYHAHKQLKYAQNEADHRHDDSYSTICTGTFSSSMGLPCWHRIKAKLAQNQRISTSKSNLEQY